MPIPQPTIHVHHITLPPERPHTIISFPRFDHPLAQALWLNVRQLFTPKGHYICEPRRW